MYKLISPAKFGKSSTITFFQLFSSLPFFLHSLKNYNDIDVRQFDIVPQVPLALFIIFQTFFSMFCRLDNFYWSVSSLLTLPFVICILLLNPSSEFFFISDVIFLSSTISISKKFLFQIYWQCLSIHFKSVYFNITKNVTIGLKPFFL